MGKLYNGLGNIVYANSSADTVSCYGIRTLDNNFGKIPAGTNVSKMTLAEFFNSAYGPDDSVSFLHISDDHGSVTAINACIQLMLSNPSVLFTIDTGDMQMSSSMENAVLNSSKDVLFLLGNHDTKDTYNSNQYLAKAEIERLCGNQVNMTENVGSYWYKDYISDYNKVIRIIALDEYEYTAVGRGTDVYPVVYSEEQMRWLCELLMNTPSDYYIILAHHQAAAFDRDVNYRNDFVSLKATGSYFSEGHGANELPAKIINSYLNGELLNGEFECGDYYSSLGKCMTSMTLNYDFSKVSPATFLFHIGGHTHHDIVDYLPNYPNQLQILVDRAASATAGYEDLTGTDASYSINKVTLDFNSRKIKIERIGRQLKTDGTKRISIEFPFVK